MRGCAEAGSTRCSINGRCGSVIDRRPPQAEIADGVGQNFCNPAGQAARSLQWANAASHNNDPIAKSDLAVRTNPIEEPTTIAEVIGKEFSDSIFFTRKRILKHDDWDIRQLHGPSRAEDAAPTAFARHARGRAAPMALKLRAVPRRSISRRRVF